MYRKIVFSPPLNVLYSDTDSLYIYGENPKIRKVQDYSNTFNNHPHRFGEDNLKDEGEDIVAFWGIKRKRYLKVIRKNNKNPVVIKGINGNRDIGWRDVYFRLSCIMNGETNISKIVSKIQNNDFKLCPPILKSNLDNVGYLEEKINKIKAEIKKARKSISKKQQR